MSPRLLVVLMTAGSTVATVGTVAIWQSGGADEPTDAGRRPAFGTTGRDTGAAVRKGGRGAPPAPALPVELSAPSVGLRTTVVPVGVDRTGAMALPGDVSRVGWYRYGPRPGSATGSAVLAGHVDSRRQGIGALASLRRVSPGDRLTVRLADGRSTRYRTVSRETIRKRAMPLEAFFARGGRPRLTVITCGGPFDTRLRSYRDNLVITAVPVPGHG